LFEEKKISKKINKRGVVEPIPDTRGSNRGGKKATRGRFLNRQPWGAIVNFCRREDSRGRKRKKAKRNRVKRVTSDPGPRKKPTPDPQVNNNKGEE